MIDHIKRFILFLLPIVRTAGVQVAADLINDLAYGGTTGPRPYRRRPYYTSYNRMATRPPVAARGYIKHEHKVQHEFHDVLMVAFDLKGRSAEDVHQWLMNEMPVTGDHYSRHYGDINLDSWWVANDERFDGSDTDSAVFVKKGQQKAGREALHSYGLVD